MVKKLTFGRRSEDVSDIEQQLRTQRRVSLFTSPSDLITRVGHGSITKKSIRASSVRLVFTSKKSGVDDIRQLHCILMKEKAIKNQSAETNDRGRPGQVQEEPADGAGPVDHASRRTGEPGAAFAAYEGAGRSRTIRRRWAGSRHEMTVEARLTTLFKRCKLEQVLAISRHRYVMYSSHSPAQIPSECLPLIVRLPPVRQEARCTQTRTCCPR